MYLYIQVILSISLLNMIMATDSDITKLMKHHEIIPDVIDEGPNDFLKISYDSDVLADKGIELTPTQVKNQPNIEWSSADPSCYYTLIFIDPDVPSRTKPIKREWLHWLVVNIPGNDLNKGEVLVQFVGSATSKFTGLHRYVFLLYKQAKQLYFDEMHLTNTSAEGRSNFSTKMFAKKYELSVPLAGNFYQAQWDEYVPILRKHLGI